MNASRYALVIDPEELEVTPAPNFTPKNEADKARQWLAGLDLDGMIENDVESAEFYKYAVGITRGRDVFYISTRSPQQKQRRYSCTTQARGDRQALTEGLERFVQQMESKVMKRTAQRDAKREARASFVNPYKVGGFLNSSWGYDQTNKEFYQILEVRELSLKIREVTQKREVTGFDQGTCTPVRDSFKGESRWVTIQVNANGYHWINSPIHGHLYEWDGKPEHWSSYA